MYYIKSFQSRLEKLVGESARSEEDGFLANDDNPDKSDSEDIYSSSDEEYGDNEEKNKRKRSLKIMKKFMDGNIDLNNVHSISVEEGVFVIESFDDDEIWAISHINHPLSIFAAQYVDMLMTHNKKIKSKVDCGLLGYTLLPTDITGLAKLIFRHRDVQINKEPSIFYDKTDPIHVASDDKLKEMDIEYIHERHGKDHKEVIDITTTDGIKDTGIVGNIITEYDMKEHVVVNLDIYDKYKFFERFVIHDSLFVQFLSSWRTIYKDRFIKDKTPSECLSYYMETACGGSIMPPTEEIDPRARISPHLDWVIFHDNIYNILKVYTTFKPHLFDIGKSILELIGSVNTIIHDTSKFIPCNTSEGKTVMGIEMDAWEKLVNLVDNINTKLKVEITTKKK